ncbi:hypothetical protein OG799_05225 [Micromonospora sp. NBC_00898]|nr:hypothetical protein OG799_05225 [Micromonospora sp. NBC_00898]
MPSTELLRVWRQLREHHPLPEIAAWDLDCSRGEVRRVLDDLTAGR